jgi:hypothetical protein
VDEVAVYNAALTAAEILEHATAAAVPGAPTTGQFLVYQNGA